MALRGDGLVGKLAAIERELGALHLPSGSPIRAALERWRTDAAALGFHLAPQTNDRPRLAVVLGGTGTGKSTLINRLLDANVTAASFRRTFTAGAIAVARSSDALPPGWLGLPHVSIAPQELPARGQPDQLAIAPFEHDITRHVTLVDTPDLDGDQPLHHAQADRAFRWAQLVVFLVTPEKYQMTELLPYYRLAERYAVPAVHVMNKADGAEVVEDYAARLVRQTNGLGANATDRVVYVIPRDDAAYEPPVEANLDALRQTLTTLATEPARPRAEGLSNRAADLLNRLQDQLVAPLQTARRHVDTTIRALRAMETPAPGVDVNPITRQLQRRLQQRSILYLMGPQRMLDRVRQVPGLLARLPRTTWDLLRHGRAEIAEPMSENGERTVPDFGEVVRDQLAVVQSRVEDVVRSSESGAAWIEQDPDGWSQAKFDPSRAAAIADEELADLRNWLEQRWNATPRDTMLLQKLLKHLPGGERLTKWSESAPYLLTIIVATHGAFLGHIDLMIIGGYSLATWLSERLSNEVAARTRRTNRRINEHFEQLAHEQIEATCAWLASRVPDARTITRLQRLAEEAMEAPVT